MPWGLTLVGGAGGRIFLVDAPSSLAVLKMFQAHAGPVTALAATGAGVVSGGGDGALKVWRRSPGRNEVDLVHTYSFGGAAAAGAAAGAAAPGAAPGGGGGGGGGGGATQGRGVMAEIMSGAPARQHDSALPKALRNAGPPDRDAKLAGGKQRTVGAHGAVRAVALLIG